MSILTGVRVRLTALRECVARYAGQLLAEGRIEDARNKYPDLNDEDFEELVHNQPAGSNNKYLMWGCKQLDYGFSTDVTIQAIRLFDGNRTRLEKKDINQYDEVGDIETAVAALPDKKSKKKKRIKRDSDLVYSDDNFVVIRPHTQEASCKYGTGTKWCISATQGYNYFSSYSTSNNKFYFVIDRKAEGHESTSKFAIAIIDQPGNRNDRIQVYNAPDKLVSLQTVANHVGDKWPEIWQKIQDHVREKPTTREVDDRRRGAEEHAQRIIDGESVTDEGVSRAAGEATLSPQFISALLRLMGAREGAAGGYSDIR